MVRFLSVGDKMKFIKIFINTFISLILILVISISMFLYCSKSLISKENISQYVKNADILNADMGILFNREASNVTLKQQITDLAFQNNIPQEIIYDILKSEQINLLLGDFFNQTILYIVNGHTKPVMLTKTVEDMQEVAHASLDNHINIMMEEEQLDEYVENYCQSIVSIIPERSETLGNLPVNAIEKIITFNSFNLYVISVLLVVLLAIINKAVYKSLKYLGVAMLVSGIFYIVVGSMDYVISNYVLNQMSAMKPFISPLITSFLTICFKNGVLISFTSIILILCFLTMNAIAKD